MTFDPKEAIFARCLVTRFRRQAREQREAVNGYWTRLADQVEGRLLKRTGWAR